MVTMAAGSIRLCSKFTEKETSVKTPLGVSENSVPLNPMVLLIIIPIKWLCHWEYTQHFQTNTAGDEDFKFEQSPATQSASSTTL